MWSTFSELKPIRWISLLQKSDVDFEFFTRADFPRVVQLGYDHLQVALKRYALMYVYWKFEIAAIMSVRVLQLGGVDWRRSGLKISEIHDYSMNQSLARSEVFTRRSHCAHVHFRVHWPSFEHLTISVHVKVVFRSQTYKMNLFVLEKSGIEVGFFRFCSRSTDIIRIPQNYL